VERERHSRADCQLIISGGKTIWSVIVASTNAEPIAVRGNPN